MRIVPFLLIASGAAALSGAALAQSGSLPGRPSGNPAAVSGSWLKGHGFGRNHDFRRGPGRHHRGRGRHHGRFDRDGDRFALAYGGIGYAEGFEAAGPHGNGFFAGGGGQVRLNGGRPYYDYDRGYPYEWASASRGSTTWVIESGLDDLARCTSERGVRVCRGR